MTIKQKNYKAALIKSIHSSDMYKNIYADDRELYETMLENRFKVKSSKDMGIDELIALDNFMNKRDGLRTTPKKVYATQNQVNYIKTLWVANSRTKTIESLLELVSKILKRKVTDLDMISKKEASQIIASVKDIKPPVKVQSANNANFKALNAKSYKPLRKDK